MVPSLQQLITPSEKILRRVILYPDPENLASLSHFIVIDFMRQTLPVSWETVTVPFYPEPNDVHCSHCCMCRWGKLYFPHQKCSRERQNSETFFIIFEDPANPGAGLYVRESQGHGSLQLVDTGKGMLGNRRL